MFQKKLGILAISGAFFSLSSYQIFAQTLTVCPSGTSGQNGCDFIGGIGIQQAVDSAQNDSTIFIKSGSYNRNTYNELILDDGTKAKCFLDTKGKNLILQGEEGAVIDGRNSTNTNGICANNGVLKIKNLRFAGLKRDPLSCQQAQGIYCSWGGVVSLGFHVNSEISFNIFEYNGSGIFSSSQIDTKVINNTFYQNISSDLYLYNNSNTVQKVTALNNIFAKTRKNEVNAEGYGIRTNGSNPFPDITLRNNLFWQNEGACTIREIWCTANGSLNNVNPQFQNENASDFHLQPSSPAKDAGDPEILDPDGSRSDIGAYGGPYRISHPSLYLKIGLNKITWLPSYPPKNISSIPSTCQITTLNNKYWIPNQSGDFLSNHQYYLHCLNNATFNL